MQSIDEARLETDSQYRYEFLAEFIGFGPDDVRQIQSCAMHLGPRIPQLVEATYKKLLGYDATARHFIPRQHGFDGPTPPDLSALTADHPQIQFRKDHLNRYFIALIGRAYDAKMVQYLDMVGKIHTPAAGNKEIDVPLVQMNALMGIISSVLIESISQWPIDADARLRTIQAFNKLLWIQNDFITRHYQGSGKAAAAE
ncbi:MAG: protoglobin family protein [Planctomycetaceae bacterium]|nr:protoglobin family protein [Planctomycetaceae bacterium]